MFLKNIIKYCKTEKTYHTYYRLCESYRDEFGMPRQRMVLGLGRLLEIPDLDQKILLTDRINELIKGTPTLFNTYKDQSVEQQAQHFYKELKAKKKIDKRPGLAATHIISRAVYPASEYKTVSWIKENSALIAFLVHYILYRRHCGLRRELKVKTPM